MAKRIVALWIGVLLSGVATGRGLAGPEEDAVRDVLRAYEAAWSRHDARAVAGLYAEPAMRVARGGPIVRPSRADQEAFFAAFLGALVSRGYDRSDWEQLEVRLLDGATAIASGITRRHRSDGSLLERVAVTYGLRKGADGWKIFLSATHDPETALRFR
jgi:uncharacterized protein (TIGR02246 family)